MTGHVRRHGVAGFKNGSIVPMKYVLCAVILAAFSATCYYGATEGSRKEAADYQQCRRVARLNAHANHRYEMGYEAAALAECDTLYSED
jgi:hypothetical protein